MAVRDSCLEPDLQILPNGDMTEVGERVRANLLIITMQLTAFFFNHLRVSHSPVVRSNG